MLNFDRIIKENLQIKNRGYSKSLKIKPKAKIEISKKEYYGTAFSFCF